MIYNNNTASAITTTPHKCLLCKLNVGKKTNCIGIHPSGIERPNKYSNIVSVITDAPFVCLYYLFGTCYRFDCKGLHISGIEYSDGNGEPINYIKRGWTNKLIIPAGTLLCKYSLYNCRNNKMNNGSMNYCKLIHIQTTNITKLYVVKTNMPPCTICLNTIVYDDDDIYAWDICNHKYHYDCYLKWKLQCEIDDKDVTCPICRRLDTY